MKTYLNDLKISLPVEQAVHDFISNWFPAVKSLLIPVKDRKYQLELDASYYADSFSAYCKYFRLYSAGSVLLGGALMVAETAYRIQATDKDAVAKLSAKDLFQNQDFKNYLNSEKFEATFEDAVKYKKISLIEQVPEEMLRMATLIGELTFNTNLHPNVSKALTASELIIKSSLLVHINNAKNSQRFLTVYIKEQNQHAYIGFNATEEEYELLDKWLNMPDLVLEQSNDLNDIGQVATIGDFLQWFNTLRLVLESELAHETILNELALLDFEEYKRNKRNITDRIFQISSINTISKYDIRKKVVEYLHQIMNARENKTKKEFVELEASQLQEQFNHTKGLYVLSLYQ